MESFTVLVAAEMESLGGKAVLNILSKLKNAPLILTHYT